MVLPFLGAALGQALPLVLSSLKESNKVMPTRGQIVLRVT